MRPDVLNPLFAEISSLKGVGPKARTLLEKIGIETPRDMLWHLPSGVVDRRFNPTIAEAPDGEIVSIKVVIDAIDAPPPRTRRPLRVKAHDDTGQMEIIFFHARADWVANQLPIGTTRIISGRAERFRGNLQMAHPDHMVPPDQADKVLRLEPTYPLTQGLSGKMLDKAMDQALALSPTLPEWQDATVLKDRKWPSYAAAIQAAHHPESVQALEPMAPARARLAYDELLASQLALQIVRARARAGKGQVSQGDGTLSDQLIAGLPYALTGSQTDAVKAILADMAAPKRMMRLLQGDVGAGKTIVALIAMVAAVEADGQAALMAPTEILCRQHLETITPLVAPLGLKVDILTGRDKGETRAQKLAALADGSLNLLIGTHALFQPEVVFHDLRLAVVDEQHRFGVHQRLLLQDKGKEGASAAAADVLVMTATPIPRTLTLTAYGDLDHSLLTEKPPGRQPIETVALTTDRLGELEERIGAHMQKGGRAYWVCPLVEETEDTPSDLTAAEARFAQLKARFGDQVALVHGRMKAAEKDKVMADFAAGTISLLVATTVVEVGVDVPEATIMIIERAEHFGLAQLHQLRGRVGRGTGKSTCVLVYKAPLSQTARTRIDTLRKSEDGFYIAEQDLKLRGAGDVLGTRQSGLPHFKLADLAAHGELLQMAADEAKLILTRDPELQDERGASLRVLLYLFGRDEAIRYWRSG